MIHVDNRERIHFRKINSSNKSDFDYYRALELEQQSNTKVSYLCITFCSDGRSGCNYLASQSLGRAVLVQYPSSDLPFFVIMGFMMMRFMVVRFVIMGAILSLVVFEKIPKKVRCTIWWKFCSSRRKLYTTYHHSGHSLDSVHSCERGHSRELR